MNSQELKNKIALLEQLLDVQEKTVQKQFNELYNATRELENHKKELEETNRELKENQTKFVQTEKMAGLGQLAAGVAHEINNPIGFVLSNLTTMQDYVDTFITLLNKYDELNKSTSKSIKKDLITSIDDIKRNEDLSFITDDIKQLLGESLEGTYRLKDIVSNLKSFARLDESEYKEVNINDGIESTLKIVWNELKYKCQVHKNLGDIPPLNCYPGQLNQVFLNLLINAAQSIEKKGEVTIETKSDKENIIITIRDTGCGIPEENISKLFNPFFTTKPAGKGTGLGLSISYSIIQKHNGTLTVNSEVGKGTAFTICLPIVIT